MLDDRTVSEVKPGVFKVKLTPPSPSPSTAPYTPKKTPPSSPNVGY